MIHRLKVLFRMLPFFILCIVYSLPGLSGEGPGKDIYLLVGTYSPQMHVYRFHTGTGKLELVSTLDIKGAQYLAVSASKKFVYVANDKSEGKGGEITALAFDKQQGTLTRLNAASTGAEPGCFVEVGMGDKWVVAGSYRLGNLQVFQTSADGSIRPASQQIDHHALAHGTEVPRVHCAVFSLDGKFVLATDLGLDKLVAYPFSPGADKPLSEKNARFTDTPKGYGPRHLALHPNGRYLYMIAEKSGHLVSYRYQGGELKQLQDQLSDQLNHDGKGASADIHITPNGKFLYVSHRQKANELVGYKISSSGKLKEVSRHSSMGLHPRNFVIDPTGSFLLVGNVDSGNIAVLKIDRKSGKLSPTGSEVKVEKPFCLKMID